MVRRRDRGAVRLLRYARNDMMIVSRCSSKGLSENIWVLKTVRRRDRFVVLLS